MNKPKYESDINQIFTQESELPEIVLQKAQEAFDKIYSGAPSARSGGSNDNPEKAVSDFSARASRRRPALRIPKAAAIVLACLIVTGTSAFAAVSLLTRRDRMKAIDTQEIEDIYSDAKNGGAISWIYNRELSDSEKKRSLELETAYKKNERFPEASVTSLREGETYSGKGVCLMVTTAGEENILCLPDEEMTDEELLEIIEYRYEYMYAIQEHNRFLALEKGNWESRMAALTDKEVDYYYLAACSNQFASAGGFVRGDSGYDTDCLSETEKSRFEALETAYKAENLFPEGELALIEQPEEYAGGVAICRHDGMYYLPERELTDEEILEIIDFRLKLNSAFVRISDDIQTGLRDGYPKLDKAPAALPEITAKDFAGTDGKGSLKPLETAQIGDIVRFGSYEQDNDTAEKEEIEWYVLEQTADSCKLLSVKILDCASYASEMKYTDWQDSDLRKWLNGEFYDAAFTSEEQARILEQQTSGDADGSDQKTSNNDLVSLLSYEEVLSYFGITAENLAKHDDTDTAQDALSRNLEDLKTLDSRLFAKGTEAAHANGLWCMTQKTINDILKIDRLDFSVAEGDGGWWLRTPNEEKGPTAHVVDTMGGFCSQQYVNSKTYGVRPVIQIRK